MWSAVPLAVLSSAVAVPPLSNSRATTIRGECSFGASLSGAGDVDGDGAEHLLVGFSWEDDGAGYVAAFYGEPPPSSGDGGCGGRALALPLPLLLALGFSRRERVPAQAGSCAGR